MLWWTRSSGFCICAWPILLGFQDSVWNRDSFGCTGEWLTLNQGRGQSSLLILLDLLAAFETNWPFRFYSLVGTCSWRSSCLAVSGLFAWRGRVSVLNLFCEVPQGYILSLVLFCIYMRSLNEIIWNWGVWCYQYADTQRFCISMQCIVYKCNTEYRV